MHSTLPRPAQRKPPSWFAANPLTASAPLRLFTLPFAGGGSALYRQWPQRLPGVDVVPVRLPGRETRISEPAYSTMGPLVEALAAAMRPMLDRPYALFGHSLGGLISFELCHRLRELGLRQPDALFVSAYRSPERRSKRAIMHALPEAEFIRELRDYGGLPEQILDFPEVLQLLLPTVRADFSLFETYIYRERAPLDLPIFGFSGTDDCIVPASEMTDWRDKTHAGFAAQEIEGDHFFIATREEELTAKIAQSLKRISSLAQSI